MSTISRKPDRRMMVRQSKRLWDTKISAPGAGCFVVRLHPKAMTD
jgi:hypothetical protein